MDSAIRIVWLPVNQAWLVVFAPNGSGVEDWNRLAGPYTTRADALSWCADHNITPAVSR